MKNAIVIVFQSLMGLSFRKIIALFRLVFRHPLFSILGFYATVKAYQIAKKHYPETNSTNGIGNAFRHALWCCLIPMYCSKISSPQKALNYCKKMTDLHEELFPNKLLERKMDLHNNKVGISIFEEMLKGIHRQFFEKQFFIDKIKQKLETAQILKNVDECYGNELIYLEE